MILVLSGGFLILIDTELRGSTTEEKSFKMSYFSAKLVQLDVKKRYTSFIRQLLKTRLAA